MTFKTFTTGHIFLITNYKDHVPENLTYIKQDSTPHYQIFGYCFGSASIHRWQNLSKSQHQYIIDNKETISGLFAAIGIEDNKIRLTIDPLSQFNVFYYRLNDTITLSNDILSIARLHKLRTPNDTYLFDSLAYQSPLRGLTIFQHVYAIQPDDLSFIKHDQKNFKAELPLEIENLSISQRSSNPFEGMRYFELIDAYSERLNKRAQILADTHDEVHAQLTGGADSRLVMSSLKKFRNSSYYCYGDGQSQNRLCYEALLQYYDLQKCNEIIFCGQSLVNSSLIIKALVDSNFRKLNNIDTYINSDQPIAPNKCKVTGYYGANISGSVVLPPHDTQKNSRTRLIPESYFTYHDYVHTMKERHGHLRSAAFSDMFYINNRGQSHYAAHSIADNLRANSYDILYDPINLELVKTAPYNDKDIDKNAISIDLIQANDASLALFPYEGRTIPRYRFFDNTPPINCFESFKFAEMENISSLKFIKPQVNTNDYDLLNKGVESASLIDMLSYEEWDSTFNKYKFLEPLRSENSATSKILLYYMLAEKYITQQ